MLSSRSIQPLVQCTHRQLPPALRLRTSRVLTPNLRATAEQRAKVRGAAVLSLGVRQADIVGGEGLENAEGNEEVVDGISDDGNRAVDGIGEEVGTTDHSLAGSARSRGREQVHGKGLRGVALEAGGLVAAEVGIGLLVEAEVGPGREETEPGEDRGYVGAEDRAREGVKEEENGREVLDANFDDAFEDGDGIFRNELFESDQKTGLEGDAAADGGEARGGQYGISRWI